jgi:hypothetical protein
MAAQPSAEEQAQFAEMLAKMEELQRTNPAALAEAMNALGIAPDAQGKPNVPGGQEDPLAQLTQNIMQMRQAQEAGGGGAAAGLGGEGGIGSDLLTKKKPEVG